MSLLLDNIWKAHPDWYDYDNEINLVDNTLTLYGGQTTHLMCGCVASIRLEAHDAQVLEQGTLTLRYTVIENDTTEYWKCCPLFTEDDSRRLHYTIRKNDNDGRYVVEFDKNPMPIPETHSLFTYLNSKDVYCQTKYVNQLKQNRYII